ncbi:MAG TPA: MBL fold metallo-hydrolase [Streptosporangiaceae bacterium]|jgi:L-ascorbate metabolism protein UlaG (beta-lactamase superfamily)
MRLTKLGHACVRLEKDGATLVIDPGAWSGPDPLAGAQAVLVTHEHPDHLDAGALRAALAASPDLQVWANPAIAAQLAEAGGSRVHEVGHGDVFDAAGFGVHVYGRDHAQIMPEVPVIANTGFAVDGEVFHPGDSFTVPEDSVRTLLLPVSAPWMKFAEAAAYAREVAPQRGYAIHDAILSPQGTGLVSMLLGVVTSAGGPELSRLEPGTSVEL